MADSDGWAYANNWRIAAVFLGLAIALLGIGVLAVSSFGDEAGVAGASLLALSTFLLVFSVLVFLPRLARRGAVSFSLYSRRSPADAEQAVREAIQETGKAPRVEIAKSRSDHPPRLVTADGMPARFRIETARTGPGPQDGASWTEIVQIAMPMDEGSARALRERITARLADGLSPKG